MNAIKYAGSDGPITLSINKGEDEVVCIAVKDMASKKTLPPHLLETINTEGLLEPSAPKEPKEPKEPTPDEGWGIGLSSSFSELRFLIG